MVSVPSFLLRRLYVKGTLKNTELGIQFLLRNRLGSGYAQAMLPLILDGVDVPMHLCFFSVDGQLTHFDQVSSERPFTLALNRDTTVTIQDLSLSEGPHTVSMGFRVPGLGDLRFDFTDLPTS
jgi:hydroxymethylglutaryl-CoA reductase (NADPH)